jgi:penicillin-binding protein 2
MNSSAQDEQGHAGWSFQKRIRVLWILSVTLFAAYSIYLFYLQIVRGTEYRTKATRISQQISVLPAQRGEIFDRAFAVPFVLNIDSFAIDLIPAELDVTRRDTVFENLSDILGLPIDEIRQRVPPEYYHLYQPVEIIGSVSYSTVTAIAEKIDDFSGVSWHSKPVRNYLETGSLSHVIGYVGDITRDELKLYYNQGYKAGDVIGKAGIERQYDRSLRGKDGREYRTVDVKGRNVLSESIGVDPPTMGQNLVLTIDSAIQRTAEKALGKRIGSIVVLKPATGEVLAMVSYPWYNPNIFSGPGGGAAYAQMLSDTNTPLINRVIQSSYPPASTFKTVITAGVIEEGSFPPDRKVLCQGDLSYGDRVSHCWIGKPGHGSLDLKGGLAQSCDVYFWTVGRDALGVERIVSYAKEFGFGRSTGIDLPGEIEGLVPTPQWKDRRFHEKWLGGDTMNLAIGQGYLLVTPLQLANMMAFVANDGVIYRPYLMKELRDPISGALVRRTDPEVIVSSRISKDTLAFVREALRGVITEGTARFPVNTKAVAVAGKTGTAEVGLKDRWHSWFAAYGPYDADDPQDVIVVVAMVEASNPWEWWAPYATNIIFQAIFTGQSYEEAVSTLGLRDFMPHQDRVE